MTGKSFYCLNHQGKANLYIKALQDAGYILVEEEKEAAFLLIDIDVLSRAVLIRNFHAQGKPVFMYPHTGRPVLQWDGLYPPSPHVTAVFTMAQGGVDIPHTYGYDVAPIHAVGWSYCDIADFRPCENPKKVLFAPIHPNGSGWLSHREATLNARVFHNLLKTDLEVTVRYLHELEWNGLWEEEGVTYVQGIPNQSVEDIERTDVVVSHQNYAYLSVARGKPTLMMAEWLTPMSGNSLKSIKFVRSWNKYKDDLMFPHDIMAGDTMEQILKACQEEPVEWKDRFIGNPFDPQLFVETLESYL